MRDHFDDPDVCKYNIIAFCPYDLFTSTRADWGKCSQRHDKYFKDMFQYDENKDYYRMKYIPEFISKLEKEVQKVDDRIRKSIKRIDAPMPDKFQASTEFD